jgi:hypothetical protein
MDHITCKPDSPTSPHHCASVREHAFLLNGNSLDDNIIKYALLRLDHGCFHTRALVRNAVKLTRPVDGDIVDSTGGVFYEHQELTCRDHPATEDSDPRDFSHATGIRAVTK